MPTTGLVVSGGGSKGAFAVGVIEYLVNVANVKFDIVAGSSTGALMAPLVVTNCITDLINIYTHVRTDQIVRAEDPMTAILHKTYLFDSAPLETLLGNIITEPLADEVFSSSKLMFITTVNLQTGEITYFKTGQGASKPNRNVIPVPTGNRRMLIDAILASANQPVFMPPVQVDPPNSDQYVDGGTRSIAPINIAIENGATEIYAIVLTPETHPRKETYTGMIPLLMRTIDLFTREITESDIQRAELYSNASTYLASAKQNIKTRLGLSDTQTEALFDMPGNPFDRAKEVMLHIIRPDTDLTDDSLTFDPVQMAQWINLGREKAERYFGKPVPIRVIASV